MRIALLLSPIHVLGPFNRVGLWVQGCNKRCLNCIAPEFQTEEGTYIDEEMLSDIITTLAEKGNCQGLTISGGEPFDQAESLLVLLKYLRNIFEDILVYTGYEIEEIRSCELGEKALECLDYIDVLIDGSYKDELNEKDCILRGSSNQTIHFLTPTRQEIYNQYMKDGRILENFMHDNEMITIGIHNRKDSM